MQEQQQQDDFSQEDLDLIAQLHDQGELVQGPYVLTLNGPEVSVRDTRTGFLVAFSSMRADHSQSLSEFIHDYMIA